MTAPRETDGPAKPAASRPARPVNPERLERIALHYLERFASSSRNLRAVLARRVRRSVAEHGTDEATAMGWVDALIARYLERGLLNDATYAEARASSLRRSGASARMIQAKLAAKGVASAVVEDALDRVDEDTDGDPELEAALSYCRRRRLGPHRPEDQRAEKRDKDLAALARAGFSLATARRAVGGEGGEDW